MDKLFTLCISLPSDGKFDSGGYVSTPILRISTELLNMRKRLFFNNLPKVGKKQGKNYKKD